MNVMNDIDAVVILKKIINEKLSKANPDEINAIKLGIEAIEENRKLKEKICMLEREISLSDNKNIYLMSK